MDIFDKMCFTVSPPASARRTDGHVDVGHPDVMEFIRASARAVRCAIQLSLLITDDSCRQCRGSRVKLAFRCR